MEMSSQQLPKKIEEMVKKEESKIVDDKLHSENVLQEPKSKVISLKLVESDMRTSWNYVRYCKIQQNINNNIEVFYRNYLKDVVL